MLSLTEEVLLSGSGIPAACHFLTSLNKIFYIQIQQAMEQDRLRRMESTEQENGIPWSASQDEVTSFHIGDVITRRICKTYLTQSQSAPGFRYESSYLLFFLDLREMAGHRGKFTSFSNHPHSHPTGHYYLTWLWPTK